MARVTPAGVLRRYVSMSIRDRATFLSLLARGSSAETVEFILKRLKLSERKRFVDRILQQSRQSAIEAPKSADPHYVPELEAFLQTLNGGSAHKQADRPAPPSILSRPDSATPKKADRRRTGPRPKNDNLLAFDEKVRAKDATLTDKEVIDLFRKKFPNHPVFQADDPRGALRAARLRQRRKDKR